MGLVRSNGYWHVSIDMPKWPLAVICVLMDVFAKLKLTYALQNTSKALSVSSFEAPEVIPTNTARRARSNDVITWQLRANYAPINKPNQPESPI